MDLDNLSVSDQMDSFISSYTESDATEFSDILDVFDNVYRDIKDILLKDIKKGVWDLIQNEIRQKIYQYSQDKQQTFADKRIIANLEKEIHFLKTEIETKDEKNSSKMILTETRIAMYLKMGEFGSLHAYQVTQIPVK